MIQKATYNGLIYSTAMNFKIIKGRSMVELLWIYGSLEAIRRSDT
jgi:hypothetical protein